ncbi:MAG: proline--tRNA ligase [Rickettsiales bacterium]|nr:proline--tRNA ligase [Rickettsiales bacterium]
MKLSNYFLPTLKENPTDATIASHQLMIRAGMIRQTASGIYSWLPLGLKVLRNIENIVRDELDKAGAIEILMPTIQPKELWIESGRYDDYGKEMLRIKDRHDRDILYGPTHEEVVTDLFRKNVTSYKDLPKNFYQIHWKFRDEIRPRFGVMRGREFLMKDSYSFDLDAVSARKTYDLMYTTYFKIFKRLGLKPIALRANTGAIGGDLSHEFHVLADTGESAIYYDKKFDELSASADFNIEEMQSVYAMADELHIAEKCPIAADQLASRRGIEVGHIFNFGEKYSKAMEASVTGPTGEKLYPNMGSYGIGVSRLVAAIIEASHDANGIIWPEAVAPFQVILINLKAGDAACDKLCEEIYAKYRSKNIEILYDDSKASVGQKFSVADLIGVPTQVVVGPKGAANGMVEIKNRATGTKKEVAISEI